MSSRLGEELFVNASMHVGLAWIWDGMSLPSSFVNPSFTFCFLSFPWSQVSHHEELVEMGVATCPVWSRGWHKAATHSTSCWLVLWAHASLRNCLTRTDPDGSSSRGSFSMFRAHWKLACWGSPLILVQKTRKYRAQWAVHDNCLSCLSLLILLVFFLLFPSQAYSTMFFLPVSKFKFRWYLFC